MVQSDDKQLEKFEWCKHEIIKEDCPVCKLDWENERLRKENYRLKADLNSVTRQRNYYWKKIKAWEQENERFELYKNLYAGEIKYLENDWTNYINSKLGE